MPKGRGRQRACQVGNRNHLANSRLGVIFAKRLAKKEFSCKVFEGCSVFLCDESDVEGVARGHDATSTSLRSGLEARGDRKCSIAGSRVIESARLAAGCSRSGYLLSCGLRKDTQGRSPPIVPSPAGGGRASNTLRRRAEAEDRRVETAAPGRSARGASEGPPSRDRPGLRTRSGRSRCRVGGRVVKTEVRRSLVLPSPMRPASTRASCLVRGPGAG